MPGMATPRQRAATPLPPQCPLPLGQASETVFPARAGQESVSAPLTGSLVFLPRAQPLTLAVSGGPHPTDART
jgi:hypothetical protein